MIEQKNNQKPLKDFGIIFIFIFCFIFSANAKADFSRCKDKTFREKVKQVAQEEKIDPNELLSIIAHESRCNYFVIAWNLPKAPQTAKNKFFQSLEEAKSFAEDLISTKKYRVDVGIGQINYEANIKRKLWALNEVLDPRTALNRVSQVLKERGWANYHSNSPGLAKNWQQSALQALNRVLSSEERGNKKSSHFEIVKSASLIRKQNSLLVFSIQDMQFYPPVIRNEEAVW